MGKKGRHRKGGRYTPKGTRPHGTQPRRRDDDVGWNEPEPDLMAEIRRAVGAAHPLALLDLASTLLSAVDARNVDPFGDDDDDESPEATREVLFEMLEQMDRRETTAMLTVLEQLVDDDLERRRIARVLDRRTQSLPAWLERIADAEPYRAVEMTHVLGDGDDVIIGVRFATDAELTAIAYVDHNLGTVVKDGFAIPESITNVARLMRDESDPDTAFVDIPLADAKARVVEPLRHGERVYPPLESETWPTSRPLLEWIVRLLPGGGRGYERPEWSDADRQALAARFFASSFATGLGDDDHRELVDTLVWYGCDYGNGDPLVWSPVAVEILLDDWIPRKIVADIDHLAKAPDVLRAFVRFCHHEQQITAALTRETLDAIDRWEPDYQAAVRTPRPQGPAALLAAVGALDPDGPWPMPGGYPSSWDPASWTRTFLEEAAGRPEALDTLDDAPLPDEPFDRDGIPDDVHERVTEVLELCDRCCEELLDVEYRTASRRLLARVARRGPDVFRRRGRAETAAAAICWAVRRANTEFGHQEGPIQKDLLLHFALTGSVSQRARTMLRSAGIPEERLVFSLGSPDYLVAARRRWILERREAARWGTA